MSNPGIGTIGHLAVEALLDQDRRAFGGQHRAGAIAQVRARGMAAVMIAKCAVEDQQIEVAVGSQRHGGAGGHLEQRGEPIAGKLEQALREPTAFDPRQRVGRHRDALVEVGVT